MTERYAKDVMRDPLYAMLGQRKNWIKLTLLSWVAFFVAGFGATAVSGTSVRDAVQFGASLFVWGGALRNDSRNNPIIGLLAGGEGWHNNHHADPTSARHGHKWWEFDVAWLTIRVLMLLGLATKVALPSPNLAATFNSR